MLKAMLAISDNRLRLVAFALLSYLALC